MSIFDAPSEEKLSDLYPAGTPFMLYSAEYEGVKNTTFGASHQANVTVGNADRTGETKEVRVFGRLAEMVKGMENDDLPALVTVGQDKRANVWQPVTATEDVPF